MWKTFISLRKEDVYLWKKIGKKEKREEKGSRGGENTI